MTVPSLLSLVAKAASNSPKETALEFGKDRVSYAELMIQVRALAEELEQAGVHDESVVALDLAPSIRTIVAMLATGVRGAAFMPIEQQEPRERRESMFASAFPAAIVQDVGIVSLDTGVRLRDLVPVRTGPAAYVSFTSGSTGTPKGVITEQPAITNYLGQVGRAYNLAPGDRQLQFSSIAFDIAIEEIFSTLASGATLVLRDPEFVYSNAADFLALCRERSITVLNLPTGLWNVLGAELADRGDIKLPEMLRLVVIGGEAASDKALEGWHAAATRPGFQVINTYGPTETAVAVTIGELHPGAPITIGRAIDGVDIRIVDGHQGEVADGEIGELVISGIAVARGYLGDSTTSFGLIDGNWSYRTGDLARRNSADHIEFHGREDHQVKVRGGYRVEPTEVARALLSHPKIVQAHVQAVSRPGGKVLVAFVVSASAVSDLVREVRAHLNALIPDWMQPWRIQVVDTIPLTLRGKVDAEALLVDLHGESEEGSVWESEDPEAVVRHAWEMALGEPPTDSDEGFFETGGDSLAALEFLEIISSQLGVSVPMGEIYRAPSFGDITQRVQNALVPEELTSVPTAHHTTGQTLVKMRRAGSGTLWCFLPPLSGAVTRYAAMSQLLPASDAVWAMETPASLSDGGMDRVAIGLAERLCEEKLSEFDDIVFSGYSLGGVFAHEVARRVEGVLAERAGDAPRLTALLLDPPDPQEPQMALEDAFDIFVRVGWRIPEPAEDFTTIDGTFNLPAVAEAARRAGTLPQSAKDSEVSDAWLVYASNARILDDYKLSSGITSSYLLKCLEHAEVPDGAWASLSDFADGDSSWLEVVPTERTYVIGVEHFKLMESPNDRTVVRWLTSMARRAQSDEPQTLGGR